LRHTRISVVKYVSTSGKYILKYTLIAVIDETLMWQQCWTECLSVCLSIYLASCLSVSLYNDYVTRWTTVSVPVKTQGPFCSPNRPDHLCNPRSLLFYGHLAMLLGVKAVGSWSWPLISI
jgi:hypothetical protein